MTNTKPIELKQVYREENPDALKVQTRHEDVTLDVVHAMGLDFANYMMRTAGTFDGRLVIGVLVPVPDGKFKLQMLPVQVPESPEKKHAIASRIWDHMKEQGATLYFHACEAWVSQGHKDDIDLNLRPRDDPKHTDAVVVQACDGKEVVHSLYEVVKRDDGKPVLDPMANTGPADVSGLWTNLLGGDKFDPKRVLKGRSPKTEQPDAQGTVQA